MIFWSVSQSQMASKITIRKTLEYFAREENFRKLVVFMQTRDINTATFNVLDRYGHCIVQSPDGSIRKFSYGDSDAGATDGYIVYEILSDGEMHNLGRVFELYSSLFDSNEKGYSIIFDGTFPPV